MKKASLTILFLLFFIVLHSQTALDSVIFKGIRWDKTIIADGVKQLSAKVNILGGAQKIYVLIVDTSKFTLKLVEAQPDTLKVMDKTLFITKLEQVAKMAGRVNGAVAAVNGSCYDTDNGDPFQIVKIDGNITHSPYIWGAGNGFIGITKDYKIDICESDGLDASVGNIISSKYNELMGSQPFYSKGFTNGDTKPAPRTLLGIGKEGVVMVVVDGRTNDAAGITFSQGWWLLSMLGCEKGVNLDGGGSSTMWTVGQGVVNTPSDGFWIFRGLQRRVANSVVVMPKFGSR